MGKIRKSFKQVLESVSREDFEKVFHTTLTYEDMANILGVKCGHIVNLKKYWNIDWTDKEKTQRKKFNANKVDKDIATIKRLSTNVERYGVKNPRTVLSPESYVYTEEQHDKWLSNYNKTSIEKFGVPHYSMTDEFKTQMPKTYSETCMTKYGVKSHMQVKELKDKVLSNWGYNYDNLHFDSSWELAYYIYNKDMGVDIVREPISIKYECNGKIHLYYPDFMVDGKLIEVKGDCYVNDEHTEFIDIRNNCDIDKSQAKFKCMIENVDKVLYYEDIKKYLEYIKLNYGNNYLKQFKVCNEI